MPSTYTTLISTSDLKSLQQHQACVVFDCRFDLANTAAGQAAYDEAHIPGAFYAHMDQVLSSPTGPDTGRHPLPDTGQLLGWLGDHGVTRTTQVVVYDASLSTMAVRLWWLLRWLGHEAVAVLDGGWPAWLEQGLPMDAETPRIRPNHYEAEHQADRVILTDDIDRQAGESNLVLIDVRTRERFEGIAEPIDPVAGHIPGAINIPLSENLMPDGRFKAADELRAVYRNVTESIEPDDCAVMCGSGVTACHTLLALEIAGFPGARLYAGSWSEWIRDAGRPVAIGA